MRSASVGLTADIAASTTTLCRLWRVTRRDGTVLRFTDLDQAVVFSGDTYRADLSFTCSSIFTSTSLANAQNVTIRFVMDDTGITESDLRQRKWDAAVAEVMLINYQNTANGVIHLFKGTFGQLKLSDKKVAEVEIVPFGAASVQALGGSEVYSPTCRASLGDARCTINIEALKVAITVATVTSLTFTASAATQADNYYAQGFVKWVTGDNAGTSSLVTASDQSDTSVTLQSVTKPIQVGDTGFLYPGCDKLPTTCRDKFANLVNLRAEPQVPSGDLLPAFQPEMLTTPAKG